MSVSAAPRRMSVVIAAVCLVALGLAGQSTIASARTTDTCRVRNANTGVTTKSLARAVRAARPGHRLNVKGTCVGLTTIGKSLTIVGQRSRTLGAPNLAGAKAGGPEGTIVTIKPGKSVQIRRLTIRGARPCCGGIANQGTLVLRDVVVRGNGPFMTGAGIALDGGTVVLAGNTIIRGNRANWGGGVAVSPGATLVMRDTSSVTGNSADSNGGGVIVWPGGRLVMRDAATIVRNTTTGDGGGVAWGDDASDPTILQGVRCAPDAAANVRGNTPDDCYAMSGS